MRKLSRLQIPDVEPKAAIASSGPKTTCAGLRGLSLDRDYKVLGRSYDLAI